MKLCLVHIWHNTIGFYFPVTIVIIPDVLVRFLIIKLYLPSLVTMADLDGQPSQAPVSHACPSNTGPTILICNNFQTFHLCLFLVVDFHV